MYVLSCVADNVQVYVDGEFVGGSDILMGLHKSGELETLLSGASKA